MIDFPGSPTIGQVFVSGAQSWTFDGTKWVASGTAVMPPLSTGDNRIINGDMRIDQRNNGASGTAAGYTVDRWQYTATQASKGNWGRASFGAFGFPYSLSFVSNSAYAPLAGDTFYFAQPIEADMISDFWWGAASAQPVTLSFWVASSLTGTFSGAIANYGSGGVSTRAYCFPYSIPTASTWTKIVVTIPGDTTGTGWVMSGNGPGAYLRFDFGGSTTYRAAAGWQSGNLVGVTGSVNVVAVNAATFYVTGVKLEIGSVATPYNRQSLTKSMADCQRYYEVCASLWIGNTGASTYGVSVPYAVEKRASPTITSITQTGAANGGFSARVASPTTAPTRATGWLGTATGGTAQGFNDTFSASAEL